MAITNQLLLIRELGFNDIKAYNRSLNSTPIWTETLTYPVYAWHIDNDRDKLWCSTRDGTSSGFMERYSISDTGLVFETRITLTNDGYAPAANSAMTIDNSTGDLYFSDGDAQEKIHKVLLAGTTVDTIITIAPTDVTNVPAGSVLGLSVFYNIALLFDDISNNLFFQCPFNSTDTVPAIPIFQGVDTALSVFSNSKWLEVPMNTTGDDMYLREYNTNTFSDQDYNSTNIIVKNKITNTISIILDKAFSGGSSYHIVSADLSTSAVSTQIHYANPSFSIDRGATYSLQGSSLYCGQYSGNYYAITRSLIVKFDASFNFINQISIGDHGGKQTSFNDITEDIYIQDINSNQIQCYDKHLNTINNITLSNTSAKMLIVPGVNDVPSNEIIPSIVVYPALETSTTDTTPTIAFKVGDNPSNWTQQFRVVADTTYDTIGNGGPGTVYDRAFDSWLNGVNYADCTWMYSTDYTEGNDPDIDGTWNALGTGDGVKSGGTHITDGIDTNQTGTFYVKMTIPGGSALTGGATNTPWYFNIFSYSTTV